MDINILDDTNFDLENVCRTCLQTGGEMKSIFKDDIEIAELSRMIKECSSTEVRESDGLPEQICIDCINDVKTSFKFKQKCEKSYRILKDLTRNSKLETSHDSDETERDKKNEYTQTEELTFHLCEMCDLKFISEDALRSHRYSHKGENYKCRKCTKSYARLFHLQRHIAHSHPEISNVKVLYETNQCKFCEKKFSRTEHLRKHIATHHEIEKSSNEENIDTPEKESVENIDANTLEVENDETVMEEKEELEDNDEQTVNDSETGDSQVESFEILLEPIPDSDEINELNDFPVDDDSDVAESQPSNDNELERDSSKSSTNVSFTPESSKQNIPARIRLKPGPKTKLEKLQLFCDKCNIRFETKSKYSIHMEKEHQIVKTHKCDKCEKAFTRATHLRRHEVTHLEVKPFQCEICEKRFSRIDHLNLHMVHHSEIKPFMCEICSKGFTRAEHLKKHKDSKHGEKQLVEKTEFCDVCKKGFTTSKYLQLHMKIHTQRSWSCKFCNLIFISKPELSNHQKSHVHERPFLCSECGLRFVRNDYLVIHMRRHKGEKPYKCKFCDKGFPRATDLTVHERYHTGEKTHLCTTCGKGFQRAYNLLVHTRVHTGERPYKCPHCDKRFAQGNDLKAHVRRHTGERYKCDLCTDSFIQLYHLTQHKRNQHGIDMKSRIRRVEKFITPQAQQLRMLEQQQNIKDGINIDHSLTENSSEAHIQTIVEIDLQNTEIKMESDVSLMDSEMEQEAAQHILEESYVEMGQHEHSMIIPHQIVSQTVTRDQNPANLPMMPLIFPTMKQLKLSPMHQSYQ